MKQIVMATLVGFLLVTACTERQSRDAEPALVAQPVDVFLSNVAAYCGQAFAGRISANEPLHATDPFTGQRLIMHVRECSEGEVKSRSTSVTIAVVPGS
jgi:hypothetical protein